MHYNERSLKKYANPVCHHEENRGQGSSTYRRGLREEGTHGGIGWRDGMCVGGGGARAHLHPCVCNYAVDNGFQEQEVSQLVCIKEPDRTKYKHNPTRIQPISRICL